MNIAGIGDLLSAHTGTFDWEHANGRGRSEYPFSVDDIYRAIKIVNDLEDYL